MLSLYINIYRLFPFIFQIKFEQTVFTVRTFNDAYLSELKYIHTTI